tara:strand:+ start:532 stop:927 length:396 start_codon:yes stop_codon:yes gene_type:complete
MSSNERTSALKKVYWIERDAIAIAQRSDSDTSTDYVSVTEAKTVNVHAVKTDESFVASGTGITMSESSIIPEEFHEGLTYYAIAKGYELKPETLQASVFWRELWKEQISEGKTYANKQRDGSSYHIRQHDF